MIKKIHRIWIGHAPMPEDYVWFGEEWKRLNPDWEVVDWNNDMVFSRQWGNQRVIDHLLSEGEKPGADRIAMFTQIADVIDYEIMFEFGGLYVNVDMQPVAPMSKLFEMYPDAASMPGAGIEIDRMVVNAAMWSPTPGLSFWMTVMKELPKRYFGTPGGFMNGTTGPLLLTHVADIYRKQFLRFDVDVFNPVHWSQVEYGGDASSYVDDLPEQVISVHHWGHRRNRRAQRVVP